MIDLAKIEVICGQPKPTSIIKIKNFVGLAGYCKRFIKGFSTIATPLTRLIRPDVSFIQSEECGQFLRLKELLTLVIILTIPIESEGFKVYCNASHVGLGYVLMYRGSQFTSSFWRVLQRELGTHVDLSIAFHSQIDDQLKRILQVLQDMLWACVLEFGSQWDYDQG